MGVIVATETRKLSGGAESERWHVRNEQGKVFGPVDFETLKAWACDGRLSPTNEVSSNGADWKFATSIRALEMDWVAEVTPGTFYGPIHCGAMADLIKEGSISAQSAFFVRRGMGELPAQAPQSDGQAEQLRRLADELAALRRQVAVGDAPTRQARTLADELKGALASQGEQARQLAEASAAQLERLRQQIEAQSEQARLQLAANEERLAQARQQAAALEERATQARQHALATEEHLRVTVQQLAEQAEQSGAAQRQWSARVETLTSELEKVRGERAESEARASAVHEEQVAGLKRSLADAQAALAAAHRRCAALEDAAHASSGFEAHVTKVGDEMKAVGQQLAALSGRLAGLEGPRSHAPVSDAGGAPLKEIGAELAALRQLFASFGERLDRQEQVRREASSARVVERVEAEPLEAEVLPPKRPPLSSQPPEAERATAERCGSGRAADAQPPPSAAGRTASGLSLAELEQQARRELERLGAQGATLFKKKR